MQNTQLDRRVKNTQMDRRVQYVPIEGPKSSSPGLSRLFEGPAAWLTSFVLIPSLLAVALLLPPVNLWERLQLFAYTRVGASGGVLRDSDGTMVSFPPEGVRQAFHANFTSTPRADFIAGQVGNNLYEAAQQLPVHLLPKSPVYSLEIRGNSPDQVLLDIPIPNDSLPYETLSLYSWTGDAWEYLPSSVLASEERIEARLNYAPANFVVVQTGADIPEVSAYLDTSGQLPNGLRVASEVRGGMRLRGDGVLEGELPVSAGNTLLHVHNVEGDVIRTDLINNLLLDPGQQENQLGAVEQNVVQGNFRGVVVDYRGVDALPSARADFVFLITRMAERLHASNKEVAVRVTAPTQISAEEWNTDGYDWVGLSRVVDKLIVPAAQDPRAYRAGGEMDALLTWATSKVERRKLQLELPVQSTESVGNYLFIKGYQEALRPLMGQLKAEAVDSDQIALTLDNPKLLTHLTKDETLGAYYYTYQDDQNVERTVYLEDAGSLSHKLNLLRGYNIVDVAFSMPQSGDIAPSILGVLQDFQNGVLSTGSNNQISVAFTVYNTDGSVLTNRVESLDNPRITFPAPAQKGELRAEAQLVGNQNQALTEPVAIAIASDNIPAAGAAAALGTAAAPAPAQTAPVAEEAAKTVSELKFPRVTATTIVNVRDGPSTNDKVLGQVLPGNPYQAIGKDESGQWWQIDIGGGASGWLMNEFVSASEELVAVAAKQPEASAAQTDENQTAAKSNEEVVAASVPVAEESKVDAPSVRSSQVVNLRSGPGTNFQIMTQMNAGAIYKILGKNQTGDWWQVDPGDGKPAWVIGQLVNVLGDANTIAVAADIPEPPKEEVAEKNSPAPAPAAVAAPVAVSGGGSGFGYGIQAHMVHTGQEGQVMGSIQGLGFSWAKQQVEWRVFEANQGQRDWGALDPIVNAANGAGINLLFSVVNSPPWARESGFDGNVGGPPQNPQVYGDFVGALAGKYCGSAVKAIEVWNEQNLHYEWGNKPLNAGEYVQLLAAGYNAIKSACPSMTVISGALTPAGNNGGLAMDDFAYLEQMFQAGANNYLDAVGVHPSGFNVPPTADENSACEAIQKYGNSFNGACDVKHHSWSFQSTMLGYRNIMNVYGAGGKRLWPTEFGWAAGGAFNPNYAYANDNDFNEQAEWTVQAYQMMKGWGWVGPAFLWNLNFRVVANGTEKAQWGIVNPDWSPLPAYTALANMPK